ncbi:MAG: carboxymuconolactone decarboxylase family protein [Kofleriaceae bacterium]|nr:carboxymuconolactone decarboxylase family protein [Kofleriaceae bacterium]
MKHPIFVIPDALPAMQAVSKTTEALISPVLRELVNLRASQINGCSVCVDMHARDLEKLGQAHERLWSVATWRDAPYFTEAERAALALTEALTRIADCGEPVSDEVWNEAARHYEPQALSAIVLTIGIINTWNRLNVATKQIAGRLM